MEVLMRKYAIAVLGAATAAMVAGGITTPVAAAATPPAGAAASSVLGNAPSCISDRQSKHLSYTDVWVTDHCKRSYKIKIIMAHGKDSRCFPIQPGQTRKHRSYGAHPRIDKIVTC
jgi:hypothetical protein